MYFSQWQRGKKKIFVSNPEAEAGMVAKGFGPTRVDCVPTMEAPELCEAPIVVSLMVGHTWGVLGRTWFLAQLIE